MKTLSLIALAFALVTSAFANTKQIEAQAKKAAEDLSVSEIAGAIREFPTDVFAIRSANNGSTTTQEEKDVILLARKMIVAKADYLVAKSKRTSLNNSTKARRLLEILDLRGHILAEASRITHSSYSTLKDALVEEAEKLDDKVQARLIEITKELNDRQELRRVQAQVVAYYNVPGLVVDNTARTMLQTQAASINQKIVTPRALNK